jgi:O-antigen/teichoic acid export membrane protein
VIQRVIANAGSNYASLIVAIFCSFLIAPILVQELGDVRYGIWTLVISFTGYFSLMDLGLNRAVIRYISKHEARSDHDSLSRFTTTIVAIFTGLGLLVATITSLLCLILPSLIELGAHKTIAQATLLISGLGFAALFPLSIPAGILMARQEHTVLNGITVFTTIARSIAVYVVLITHPSLIALALTVVASGLIRNGLVFFAAHRRCPHISISTAHLDWSLLPEMFQYSLHSGVISFASRIIQFTDEIVVATFLSVALVTPYSFAVTLISHFEKLVWAGASVLVPAASQLAAVDDKDGARKLFLSSSRTCAAFTLFLFGLTFMHGPAFIGVWIGHEYEDTVAPIIRVLLVARLLPIVQSAMTARLLGTSDHAVLSKINGLEAVANLVLSVLLIQRYGLMGVAMGTLLPSVICNGIVLPRYTLRLVDVSAKEFLSHCLAAPFLACLVAMGMVFFFEIHPQTYTELVFASIAFSFLYGLVFLIAGLKTTEKRWVWNRFKSQVTP